MSIGKRLRRLRERKGITSTELARQLHALPSQVSRWELDKVKPTHYLAELMAFFGVTEGEITGKFTMLDLTQAMKANRLQVEDLSDGIYVSQVTSGGPASKAGVQQGDVIVKLDDVEITTYRSFLSELYSKQPGDTVTLVINRNGDEMTVKVTLAEQ